MKTSYKKTILIALLEIFMLSLIVLSVQNVIDFQLGAYMFAGDFRPHIDGTLRAEYFVHIFSDRFSTNNFTYIPFYPMYQLLHALSYQQFLMFIFFGIPILLYTSIKFVLLSLGNRKKITIGKYVCISAIAFSFAVNASLFDRYVHFPILYGAIFFAPYMLALHRYISAKRYINKYLLLAPVLLYFGAVTPQLVVVYFLASLTLCSTTFLVSLQKAKIFTHTLLAGVLCSISFLHIIYASVSGFLITRSIHESATTSDIFSGLAGNSNIYTALSGTNFYDPLVIFPTLIGVGYLMFVLLLYLLVKSQKVSRADIVLLIGLLIGLVVVGGYNTFSTIYDLVNNTLLHNFTWLVKDPNIYYLYLLSIFIVFLGKKIRETDINSKQLSLIGMIILLGSTFFIYKIEKSRFNDYYSFIHLPAEYVELSEDLKNDKSRNLWIPPFTYVTKNFAAQTTHFPSPSFWLTNNKEITYLTQNYKELIQLFNSEIYEKKCENTTFLNWLIAVQDLNIVVDRNSINNKKLGDSITEDYVLVTRECMSKMDNAYLYKTYGKIDVYKSNLKIDNSFVRFSGTIADLNIYLEDNKVNVIFTPSETTNVEQLDGDFSILNESYDLHWRTNNNASPVDKVNFSSMLFQGDQDAYYYKGEKGYEFILIVQRTLIALLFAGFVIFNFERHEKKDL